jgi:hypothetical protein
MSVRHAGLLLLVACSGGTDAPDAPRLDAAVPDAFVPDGHVSTDPTVEPGCVVNGCVRAFTGVGSFSAATLRSAITDTRVVIDNGIDIWRITYWSDGREITGTVVVPQIAPPPEGFSTVVQGQSTTGLDDSCTPSAGIAGAGIGGGLAVRGLLVIVPDAPGLGTPGPEAWLVSEPSGRSLLDAARAGPRLSQALGVAMTTRSVILGHSQGGHSAQSAAVERPGYAPELDIRGFAAADPPSEARLLVNDALPRTDDSVSLGVTLFYAWQRWYGLRAPPYVIEPYFSNADTIFVDCFYDSAGTTGPLWDDFPHDGAQVFTPDTLAMAANDAWIEPWASLLAANTPWPIDAAAPIRIYQGAMDYLVPQFLTAHYVAGLRALGIDVEYVTSPDSGHSDTALGPLTAYQAKGEDALDWIRGRLGVP